MPDNSNQNLLHGSSYILMSHFQATAPVANALIHEQSPYLLQHAYNPVQWNVWSAEVFERARRENKPVFLSIGYATCHWCHVMERESFEHPDIAALLNEHFIPIKVDREERPDIDAVYMAFCQALTGHGGWPLSVFLTPDEKPFYVGTYFPPQTVGNRPGFSHVLQQIAYAWREDREAILSSSDDLTKRLQERLEQRSPEIVPSDIQKQAFTRFEQLFDPQFGGFGTQPKFPSPQNLLFLLRYFYRTGNPDALTMVTKTLDCMRSGGIYDHIGYGFHRYSTDRQWVLPHFEKMLYDQAMLAIANLETFQVTGLERYARTAEEIFTYVLRDMSSPEGAFYSAEDADSEGREGKFYVWTQQEIYQILGESDGALFCAAYSVLPEGNFNDEASGKRSGENIIKNGEAHKTLAQRHDIDPGELSAKLSIMRQRLFEVREKRIRPLNDDKILTDWNGLMIAAFAIAGRALDNALYTRAAERAWKFITQHSSHEDRLYHRWRGGHRAIPAFLDDYAFLAWATLELYHTTLNVRYLHKTRFYCDEMLRLFLPDGASGALALQAHDQKDLIITTREGYDGAIPSGNSIAATVLARFGLLTSSERYLKAASAVIQDFAAEIRHHPVGFAQMLIAKDLLHGQTTEIILAGSPHQPEIHEMLGELQRRFLPASSVILNTQPDDLATLVEQASYQTALNGDVTVYICERFLCKEPLHTLKNLQTALDALGHSARNHLPNDHS